MRCTGEVNGIKVTINEHGVHFFTPAGLVSVTPNKVGVFLNSRDYGSTIGTTSAEPHLLSVEIINY